MTVYVVTGASRGLGYALIKNLASDPSNTVFGLVRNKAATDARLAADKVTNVHILAADIIDQPALNIAAKETKEVLAKEGKTGVDVLINNAGYISDSTHLKSLKDFEEDIDVALEDTQKSFEINLFGTMKVISAFLPLVRASTLKKVVAISSGMGDIDLINEVKLPNAVPYAASKAALSTTMAKYHAAYSDEGLLFFSLCPGWIDTSEGPVTLSPEDQTRLEDVVARFMKYAVPGYHAATPEEAAGYVLMAVDRSTLEGGNGGTLLSYNGTKRWM